MQPFFKTICVTGLSAGRRLLLALTVVLVVLPVAALAAAESHAPGADKQDPGKKARHFALPVELDVDTGADNGDAAIFRLAPLYSVPLNERWKLVNLDLIIFADAPGGVPGRPGNPSAAPGGRALGLGDFNHASFFTPINEGPFVYGFGVLVTAPTASDTVLGSGKWSAGPAVRLVYREAPWNIGFIAGNVKSFAGSSARADVNRLLIRGAIRRQLPNRWYLVSAPMITANWKSESGQRWVVPIGGGVGRRIGSGERPTAVSLQGYYNAIKPDGAPDWVVRLQFIIAI